MKKIKIAYVDFWKNFDYNNFFLHEMLTNNYEVEVTKDSPDFVICSVFGHDVFKYSCPRILFVGEVYCPDFNIYDYAIGFDRIQFGDRYLRFPLSVIDRENLSLALEKHLKDDDYYNREGFCSFVVSSGGGVDNLRDWYFEKISEYKQVTSGGRFKNNLPDGKPVEDKRAFQEGFRFSLCFENTSFPGYATEKILDAWASGCIPIYFGDPEITKDFNEKSFIQCKGKDDFEQVLKRIKEIEDSRELYLEMVHEPILCENSEIIECLGNEKLMEFLCYILDQPKHSAYRRNSKSTMWGKFYEYQLIKLEKIEHNKFVSFLRKWKRKLFGLKKIV